MSSTANTDENLKSELLTIPKENFDRLVQHCKQESQHEERE
ncbi:hypothetical protein [Nesterenkonia alba]|nr:hypothetical protein [Nesterenkonia alba]